VKQAVLEAYLAEIAEIGFEDVQQTRLVVQVAPEERAELETRLESLLEEFRARPRRPGAERTAIYLATYPST
jgi:hypothetical protein